MCDFIFRPARPDDQSFLLEAIVQAEKLTNGQSSYAAIYGMNEAEVQAFLAKALALPGRGCQLSLDCFFVLIHASCPVACCCAWVEADDGVSSGFKLAAILTRFLGLPALRAAAPALRAFAQVSPVRTPGALQLEAFYVAPDFLGQGLVDRLIASVQQAFAASGRLPQRAEISLLQENTRALRAYTHAGFSLKAKSPAPPALFVDLTGSAGMIQLQKSF